MGTGSRMAYMCWKAQFAMSCSTACRTDACVVVTAKCAKRCVHDLAASREDTICGHDSTRVSKICMRIQQVLLENVLFQQQGRLTSIDELDKAV